MRLAEGSRPLIRMAFIAAVRRAIDSGDLRSDTDPNDFVCALVGVFHTTDMPGWDSSARRLVGILITGSRALLINRSAQLSKRILPQRSRPIN